MDWLEVDVLTFQYFILVFARIATMIMFAPIIGSASIPGRAKAGFAFLISIIIFPIVSRDFPALPENMIMFWAFVIREVLVGLMTGVIGSLLFSAVQLSGQIFGMQIGFGIVNVMDPLSDEQISILGQFIFMVVVLLFLVTDAHHVLIKIFTTSYTVVPMGGFSLSQPLQDEVMMWLTRMFLIAFKIGMPVVFVLLLVSVAMGILARTVPQLNIFIVGLPINIFIGMFVLGTTVALLPYLMRGYFTDIFTDMYRAMRLAGGAFR